MVAQVGDSHFAVLLRNEGDDQRAHAAAERIGGRLRAPFRIGGREVVVSAALGFVTSSRFHTNAESALADAEAAAHRAQRFPQRFQTSMRVADRREVALAAALPRAIERNELQARYQPIIDLQTGEVVSVEALVRWMHPELGLVSPGEFVPLAETSDAILALDRWMLVESTRQLAAWGSRVDLRLSVNISARHLEHPRLPEAVAAALSASGLAPSRLRIEVTETAFAGDVQGSIDALHRLRQIGVSLALDDFGTGYASFAQLADLPFDVLKIDRSMIGRLDGLKGRNVVPGIVSMAHQLGLEVVAEGIETASQVESLRALGSDFGQGFLFSKPLPGNQLLDLLTNRPIW
jgi:EAL domain-containing protein (putative c-di-GMP-specific phosphodiesterase class I)